MGRTVLQYLSAAFIQAKTKVGVIGGNRLWKVLPRCKQREIKTRSCKRKQVDRKLRSFRNNAIVGFLVRSFKERATGVRLAGRRLGSRQCC
jgi:hypothetical protein